LRQLDVDVLGWARDDCSAVIDAIRAEYPHHPLVWVGHSLGGQILPFVRSPERVDRAVFVATGSGYWRNAPVSVRPRVWFLCHLLGPLLSETMGYFPARLLGALDDLPSGVVRQWCAWCRDPAYSTGSERAPLYRGLTLPITSISFRDDEFMSERNTADFLGAYASARLRHRWVEAAEFGLPRLGHFGFFRAQPDLWQALLAGELP
jgi:predicted alpha/beta hydrolase